MQFNFHKRTYFIHSNFEKFIFIVFRLGNSFNFKFLIEVRGELPWIGYFLTFLLFVIRFFFLTKLLVRVGFRGNDKKIQLLKEKVHLWHVIYKFIGRFLLRHIFYNYIDITVLMSAIYFHKFFLIILKITRQSEMLYSNILYVKRSTPAPTLSLKGIHIHLEFFKLIFLLRFWLYLLIFRFFLFFFFIVL